MKRLWKERHYLVFIAPALVVYLIFSIYPMFSSFYYSLTDWDGYSVNVKFIGLKNFAYLFKDDSFKMTLRNTLIFVVMDVVIQNIFGLLNAMILESRIYGRNVMRALFFIPVVLPAVVVSYLWTYIYGYNDGILNEFFAMLHVSRVDFIGDKNIAIFFVILTEIWQWTSYRMVIYISGLQNISKDIYEAAAVDGAKGFTLFRNITVPMLAPAFKINMILCTIGALKQFDAVFTMTNGGPGNSTEVIATKIFHEAFSYSDYGYGCAIGVVLFFFILIVTLVINTSFNKREAPQ